LVTRTTGQPTIDQMRLLAEEVKRRGGQPQDPQDYKLDFVNRLGLRICYPTRGYFQIRINNCGNRKQIKIGQSIDALRPMLDEKTA
jgi:hypothetical protein